MQRHDPRSLTIVGAGAAICLAVTAFGQLVDPEHGPAPEQITTSGQIEHFLQSRPGTALHWEHGRIARVYGKAFSTGASAEESVEQFIANHSGIFGVPVVDLDDAPPLSGGQHVQPLVFEPATGTYKFTAFNYTQVRSGVPVFRSKLTMLVRNEPGFPLVLASADLRDLGPFQVNPAGPIAIDDQGIAAAVQARYGAESEVTGTRLVIFAGVDEQEAAPRLANETYVVDGVDEWLLVTDAQTGELLYEEYLICFGGGEIAGNIDGRATEGIGAEQCEEEPVLPLPYLEVTSGGQVTYTDVNGEFLFPITSPNSSAVVEAMLRGLWFDVFNQNGGDAAVSTTLDLPATAEMIFNAFNFDEGTRAQVNGYVHANVVRDYTLQYNPDYPTLNNGGFPVTANNVGGLCPGNAWYSPGEQSINFCQSGGGNPNTAWSSVIYHEYGHHLVAAGGSGQGAYGEGMGDVMSVLLLDDSRLGLGFFGDCNASLRNADNDCQYQQSGCSTCGSEVHACGNTISGAVWSVRNELAATNPATYRDILSSLAINSIFLHNGSSIDPSITIDYLTLDDDNDNILDGTPHYGEISVGFAAHNMDAPEVAPITFFLPDGVPELISPFGDATIRVNVVDVTGTAEPGTGVLHLSTADGAPFTEIPMQELVTNEYQATFPEFGCGTSTRFYFSAETTSGQTLTWPNDAPASVFSAVAATSSTSTFDDDFESDQGWTVQNSAGLDDGAWERGVPVGGGDRGDPPTDADGSGQCYLTNNADGNTDVDGGSTTLTSPPMDATVSSPYITYSRWYSNSFGDSPFQDVFTVEVSDDGGQSWTNLETVGPGGSEVSGGWFFKQFDLTELSGFELNDQLRIRFTASDLGSGSVVEAGVDGVELRSYNCDAEPSCPADLDGNMIIDVQDLVALIVAWGTDDAAADLDGSGIVDVGDLVMVIVAWGDCSP